MKKKPTGNYYALARTELLPFFTQPVGTVLELGCGEGKTLRLLQHQKLAKKVIGVDIDAHSIERAKKYLDIAIVADVENDALPFNKGQFDVVMLPDILEHLRQPEVLLEKVFRWLKPQGYVIVSVPNVQHISVIQNLWRGRWDYTDAGIMDRTHLRFFTRATLTEMLEQAGFSVTTVRYNGGYLPGWKGLVNWLSGNRLRVWFISQYLIKAKKK